MGTEPYWSGNKLWVDYVLTWRNPSRSLLILAAIGALPFITGALIASSANRLNEYLETPAFYLGTIGILITIASLSYGSFSQHIVYDRVSSCYNLSDLERRGLNIDALGRHSDFRAHLRSAFIIYVIAFLAAASGAYNLIDLSNYSITLPRFSAFAKNGWYDQGLEVTFLMIMAIYLIPISAALGTSASIILRMPIFLWRASERTPRYPPNLIKMHFTPAASFYARISILWLIGTILVFYFLKSNKDFISYAVILAIFLLGLLNFFIPQIAYVRTIAKAEDRFQSNLLSHFSEHAIESTLPEGEGAESLVSAQRQHADATSLQLMVQLLRYDDWVYPLHQTYGVIGVYVTSLVGSIVGWSKILNFIGISVNVGSS